MNFGKEAATVFTSLSSGIYSACGKDQLEFDKCRAKCARMNSTSSAATDLNVIGQHCFGPMVQFGACAVNLFSQYVNKCPDSYQHYYQCLKSQNNDVRQCETARLSFEKCAKDKRIGVRFIPPSAATTLQAHLMEQMINDLMASERMARESPRNEA